MSGVFDFDAVVRVPFGGVGIRTHESVISEAVYLPRSIRPRAGKSPLAREAARQINAYFKDAFFQFDLPLAAKGSAFQQRVWGVISSIPSGQTLSYGDVARRIRSAPRAVGQACGANWFSLLIPCHRVLAAHGIGGFGSGDGGFHLNVKSWLLAYEGVAGYDTGAVSFGT